MESLNLNMICTLLWHQSEELQTESKTINLLSAAGFQNLSDDPIFQKYKQKVDDEINEKEKVILLANQNYGEK